MAEERYEERTEPATPRRRQEARERGNVSKSADLNSAAILLAAVLVLNFTGRSLVAGLLGTLQETLGGLGAMEPGTQASMRLFSQMLWMMFSTLLPFLVVVFCAALLASVLQVGFLFTAQPLTPNLERLDPFSGMKRIFSLRGAMRLVLGLLKLAVVAVVVFLTIWLERVELLTLAARSFEQGVGYFAEIVFVVSIRAALALLVLALLDFAYQRWQHEQDIRMSRQEIKEELKRYEGDPKIRERRRAIQRQLALNRMMARVPRATVVVTNPTEISVALEYDEKSMEAPEVVAKGAGHLALRIRELAAEHDIPIVQRPPVARALYRTAEVGQRIPFEMYQAVAEILALVYRLKGRTSAA